MRATPSRSAGLLQRAQALVASGQDAAALQTALLAVRRNPADTVALGELASLAARNGYRAASRTAYQQALRLDPTSAGLWVGLGNLLLAERCFAAARDAYATALAASPDDHPAHQGLARALTALGEPDAAAPHWHQGFAGQPFAVQRFRGHGVGIPLLLLVSVQDGNIPTALLIDDTRYAVTALYAEYFEPSGALPPHRLIFNAIGDADLCACALRLATAVVAVSTAPVINPPDAVQRTGRAANAARLAALPHVRTAATRVSSRLALRATPPDHFPLLLRAPGYHTGQYFVKVAAPDALADALAGLPRETVLVMDDLDAISDDGWYRKYRVMCIAGVLYPIHLAISADWKVHYVTAAMADNPSHRAEEQRFLEDMAGVLGGPAMAALAAIADALGLDYAGIDFARAADGTVLLFEANATMVIQPPGADPIWGYRRAPIARALAAARALLHTGPPRHGRCEPMPVMETC